jgi:hypothetical protein
MSAIVVCILLFVIGGLLADASRRRPPRESEDIYFVFANIKAETINAGRQALLDSDQGYLDDWSDEVTDYLEELGYTGSLTYTDWNPPTSVEFTLTIQSTNTVLQDTFEVTST